MMNPRTIDSATILLGVMLTLGGAVLAGFRPELAGVYTPIFALGAGLIGKGMQSSEGKAAAAERRATNPEVRR
jgi:hypothetical protein